MVKNSGNFWMELYAWKMVMVFCAGLMALDCIVGMVLEWKNKTGLHDGMIPQ